MIDREAGFAFARVLDAYVETLGSRSMTYRSLGLPSDTTPRIDAFARVARANRLTLETIEDVRTGDVIARLSARLVADFATRAKLFDGERRTALAEARILVAPEKLRAGLDAWGAPPASLPLMRTLKSRFDPNGTLVPIARQSPAAPQEMPSSCVTLDGLGTLRRRHLGQRFYGCFSETVSTITRVKFGSVASRFVF